MAVTEVLEALGSFEFELEGAVPREVLDAIDYFGHVAIIPGRMNPTEYGDNTLAAARYVGVVRRRRLADDGRTNLIMDDIRIGGCGMNFWLGDEDGKGAVLETPVTFTAQSFSSVVTSLLPASVTVGTLYSVPGTYSGRHVYETPRVSIQYVCDTMSSAGTALYDTFNRANTASAIGQLDSGQSWVQTAGTWGIISNQGYISASGASLATVAVAASTDTQVTFQTISSGTGYLIFRFSTSTNYWRFGASAAGGALTLEKVVAGTPTTLATLTNTLTTGMTLRVVASGDNIYLYVNSALITQVTDTFNNSATSVGMGASAITTRFETFNSVPENSPISWRVNNDGTFDAGPETSLYTTIPTCVIVRKGTSFGEDLTMRALPTNLDLDQDMEDYSTRTLMLAEADGESVATGSADVDTVAPGNNRFKDLHGNALKMTRMVSESDTLEQNADVRAELALRNVIDQRKALELSTEDYDIYGSFKLGDYVYLYDPDASILDLRNEITIRGARINPQKLQVTETDWPITSDYTVAYRAADGTWTNLTDYVHFDDPTTSKITIGDFQRQLTDDGATVAARVGSFTQPDQTVPGQVSWLPGSFQTVNYLDGTGASFARQKLVWSVPLNVDGSNITDGDHYEIQYQLFAGSLYSQTWAAASTLTWANAAFWAAPVAPDDLQYQTLNIPWGDTSTVIHGLPVGTEFSSRIRLVDAGGNEGAWSANETWITSQDNIPPSTPAAPVVAGSAIAIQVIHTLGKASGGTFNLENDLAHLEIHYSLDNNFFPDSNSLAGMLRADQTMISAQTAAVASFPIPETDAVYVKVVAVDTSGNRSSPSVGAQVTAELIDDEYISGLTVSKLMAGTLSADIILGARIQTANSGQRVVLDNTGFHAFDAAGDELTTIDAATGLVNIQTAASGTRLELNGDGLRTYNPDGDITTNLSANPSGDGDYLAFTNGDGDIVASVNSIGIGSFTNVNTGSVTLAGQDLQTDILDPRPKGIVAYGTSLVDVTGNAAPAAKGYMELAFTADPTRMYRVYGTCDVDSNQVTNDGTVQHSFGVLDGGPGIPTVASSPSLFTSHFAGTDSNGTNVTGTITDMRTYSAGVHRLLWTFASNNSGSTITPTMRGADGPAVFYVEDLGDVSFFANTGLINPGTGTSPAGDGGSGNHQGTFIATWGKSYDGAFNTRFTNQDLYQGTYDGNWGSQRSLIGFDNTAISNLVASGATILKIQCRMYANHWYYDYGGTAALGWHEYMTPPSTWSSGSVHPDIFRIPNWPKPGFITWTLPDDFTAAFIAGTAGGISVGPHSGDFNYYGKFSGQNASSDQVPRLIITYSN